MLIAYASRTGNVRRFIGKTGLESVEITPELVLDSPFVLVTYTTGFGEVPKLVNEFLAKNSKNMVGVAASGNRNWGNNYAKSADKISLFYNVPIIAKFEMSGTSKEVELFIKEVARIEAH